ncbi:MAG TPA: carbohydrate ABC transporter permease [Clostridiales bacterium]|nr:carbohydrate ABC transporter permease [Clostridiales bacterium]
MIMYFFLLLVFAFMLIPFVWLIISSFRPNADLFNAPFAIPEKLSFENYIAVFQSHPMLLYFGNSVAIAFLVTVITIFAAVMASYACIHRFRVKPGILLLFSLGLFIPTNAFMVPYYVLINRIGLYDNILGIALVYAGINFPMSFMVIKGYMDTIPAELKEAACIDGAKARQVLMKVILPISVPGIVTACVFIVINSWNELLFANLLNQSDKSRTIQVAIRSFLTTFEANYAYAFAAMVVTILPTIIIYALLTDKIIGGMTAGSVKG